MHACACARVCAIQIGFSHAEVFHAESSRRRVDTKAFPVCHPHPSLAGASIDNSTCIYDHDSVAAHVEYA